jgi:hypothetical protein
VVRTETAVADGRGAEASPAMVVEERRSETRTVNDDEPRGVISTTVHFIGEILALPFRLVGGLLRAIF